MQHDPPRRAVPRLSDTASSGSWTRRAAPSSLQVRNARRRLQTFPVSPSVVRCRAALTLYLLIIVLCAVCDIPRLSVAELDRRGTPSVSSSPALSATCAPERILRAVVELPAFYTVLPGRLRTSVFDARWNDAARVSRGWTRGARPLSESLLLVFESLLY